MLKPDGRRKTDKIRKNLQKEKQKEASFMSSLETGQKT